MKFDVIVMNPPYQKSDGEGSSATPVYNLFIDKAISIQPQYILSINPSRWMAGGKGLSSFRLRMMKDRRIKLIVDDMSQSGFFPKVEVAGGVSYFLWDKSYNGKCNFNGVERYLDEEDIVIREVEAIGILNKVKNMTSKWLGESVSPIRPYGIDGNEEPQKEGLPCWFKQSIGLSFVSPNIVINNRNDVDSYRVLSPRASSNEPDFSRLVSFFSNNSLIIASPGEYCSSTYVILKSFKFKKEAEHFLSYVKTKFFRFMLRMRVISQDINRNSYNWVPDFDAYKEDFCDKKLFNLYNLSELERDFIDSKIASIK